MKQMSLEETKQVEFEILKNVSDFCERNNLRYFLAFGTLIGAVRHKGFIPWDDDVDIWMPKEDYDKFIELFKDENNIYKVVSPYEKIARHTFAKVIDTRTVKIEKGIDYSNGYLGVDIDVFPLEGQPLNDDEFFKWYDKIIELYRKHIITIIENKGNLKRKLLLPIVKLLLGKGKKYIHKAAALHLKYPYKTSEFVGVVTPYDFNKMRCKREWFEDAIDSDFEGLKFKIPKGYHEILTVLYGDYMTPPPEDKRITHHLNNTFWIDD